MERVRLPAGRGLRTQPSLSASGLHMIIRELVPLSRAQLGELRTARAQAARVDADASMPRGTAIRARRAAEATCRPLEPPLHIARATRVWALVWPHDELS